MEKTIISVGKTNLIYYGNEELSDDVINKMTYDEKELFKIVRDCSIKEYRSIIEHRNSFFYLNNLSELRQNVVRWLPIEREDTVLEIGAKTGAISTGLFELSENLTLFEQKPTHARILAERFANCKDTRVISGDFYAFSEGDNTSYDWIVIYDMSYLNKALQMLNPEGHIVLISNNRLGLKYLAGNKAPGSDSYFSYVEGYDADEVITYSEIEALREKCAKEVSVYYPYPDLYFAKNIYSDRRLPLTGELVDNLNNYESDRMLLFSEKDAFDRSCSDGSFKYISNSYVVIIGKKPEAEYIRFSNDRTDDHAIYTTISTHNGSKWVKKYAYKPEAYSHINDIYRYYGQLTARYENSPLFINKCNILGTEDKPYVSFEYVEGTLLSELMDRCIKSSDMDGFYKLFDKYVKYLEFDKTGEITDIDAVFSNIIVNDGEWTLIDYEWCRQGIVEIKETAYRAIYCFMLEDAGRNVINLDYIREKLVLSKAATDEIEADEMKFQKMVTGKLKALGEIREALGHKAVNPIPYLEKMQNEDEGLTVQVYPSDANGSFSEDTSYFLDNAYVSSKEAEILISLDKNMPLLRIDPMNNRGLVTIEECRINEFDYPFDSKKRLVSNGRRINKASFVFNTMDPNLIFDLQGLVREEDSFMFIKLRIDILPEDLCESLSLKPGIKDFFA